MFYEQSSKMLFFNRLFTAMFSRTLFIFQEWGGLSLGLLNVLDLWFSWIIDKVLYRWEKKEKRKRFRTCFTSQTPNWNFFLPDQPSVKATSSYNLHWSLWKSVQPEGRITVIIRCIKLMRLKIVFGRKDFKHYSQLSCTHSAFKKRLFEEISKKCEAAVVMDRPSHVTIGILKFTFP